MPITWNFTENNGEKVLILKERQKLDIRKCRNQVKVSEVDVVKAIKDPVGEKDEKEERQ